MSRLAPFALALALLTGCGSAGSPDAPETGAPSTTTTSTVTSTTLPMITESAARVVAPEPEPVAQPELDVEQVVTAVVLIAGAGDLEAAITAGIVGEAEAEAALVALESGSAATLLD